MEDETPQRAVVRTVERDTGLRVTVRGCLDALARRGPDPASGRPVPLLHLYFLCAIDPSNPPELLPGNRTHQLDLEQDTPGGPPGGPFWGWADLASGLAALRHDVAGPAVVELLRAQLRDQAPAAEPKTEPKTEPETEPEAWPAG